jgi:hypothetical protein
MKETFLNKKGVLGKMKRFVIIFLIIIFCMFFISCSEEDTNHSKNEVNIEGNISTKDNSSLNPNENNRSVEDCTSSVNNMCSGSTSVICINAPKFDQNKKTLIISAKNSLTDTIRIIDFTSYLEKEPWPCMTNIKVDSAKISVNGDEFVDINQRPSVKNNETFQIILAYSGSEKNYIDQGFELSYSFVDIDASSTDYFKIEAIE